MPYFNNITVDDVEIDVDEFIDNCSASEIEDLIDALIDMGELKDYSRSKSKYAFHISEAEFEEALQKLSGKWNQLSSIEEQSILSIAKRF